MNFILVTILPTVIILVILTLYPFILNIYYSLLDYELFRPDETPFIGFGNYKEIFLDPIFLQALYLTVYYVVLALVIELALGLLIAQILSGKIRGKSLFRTLIILPMTATPICITLIWRLMYNVEGGLINTYLRAIGLPSFSWTSSSTMVIPSLVLVDAWQWTPFVILILLAGLLSLPEEPFEAARIDGASSFQMFRYVTLPLLKPAIFISVLFRLVDSLKQFDIIWVMTKGGPADYSTTLNILAFKTGFQYLNMGKAGALAIIILIIAIALANILVRFSGLQK